MVKVTALEVPPPGVGLVTVTDTAPAEAMAVEEIAAVNCVELTNSVGAAIPPKLTIEAVTKFVPLTVKVKFVPPAAPLVGETVAIVGVGLDAPGETVEPADPQP
jgi:hypothetical protein